MRFDHHCPVASAATLLLLYHTPVFATPAGTPKPTSMTQSSSLPATCEFRTINYITAALPQQCLKMSWTSTNATTATSSAPSGDVTTQAQFANMTATDPDASDTGQDVVHGAEINESSSRTVSNAATSSVEQVEKPSGTDVEGGELNEASFLSFEEWKKQTLEKVGQPNGNNGNKKATTVTDNNKRDSNHINANLDTLTTDGQLDLDFGTFKDDVDAKETADVLGGTEVVPRHDLQDSDIPGRSKDQYRSKDAGKTCKERFSYSSFDAGATILKTHPGAKNPKAVLIENKDSYMLSECKTDNKFLILELSVSQSP